MQLFQRQVYPERSGNDGLERWILGNTRLVVLEKKTRRRRYAGQPAVTEYHFFQLLKKG